MKNKTSFFLKICSTLANILGVEVKYLVAGANQVLFAVLCACSPPGKGF